MFKRTAGRAVPLALVSLLAVAGSAAHAGQVSNLSATANARLVISDSDNFNWSIDLSPLVSVDYATGNVGLNTAPTGPVDASGSDTGAWSVVTDGSGAAAMQWHSWTRQDGTAGTDTNGGANAWRSVVTFRIGGNLDPEMSYGLTFKNNTAATQTYTYSQGETMDTPMTGPFSLFTELSGSLVNAAPSTTTASMQPTGGAVQQLRLGNAGVATVNPGADLGAGVVVPVGTSSAVYGTFANTVAGTGQYDYWEFTTQFTLSGGKDVATLSGYASINPVPDAPGLALLATGLLALRIRARSRKE